VTARGGSRADRPILGLAEPTWPTGIGAYPDPCPDCGEPMKTSDGVTLACDSCGYAECILADDLHVPVVLGGQGRSPERQSRDVRIGWWILAGFALAIAVGIVLTTVGVIQVVAR